VETAVLNLRYQKTEAGRQEIRQRSLALPRSARSLLVMMDGKRTAAEWMALINGVTQDDVDRLCSAGLITAADGQPAAIPTSLREVDISLGDFVEPPMAPRPPAPSSSPMTMRTAAPAASLGPETVPMTIAPQMAAPSAYDQLYAALTSQARERLGLIKGYKLILDIERCADHDALQALARKFVLKVRDSQGPDAARQVERILGLIG